MVNPKRNFGGTRRPHRIKRNRQTIELIDRAGNVVCSVKEAWKEGVSRSTTQGVIQTHGLSQMWKLPTMNVPEHVIPETEWTIREAGDGAKWKVLSVSLRTADLTWHLQCEHMRQNNLKVKSPV